ncbi:MAG: hypothetical protein HC825_02700 [Oscillatoriales cyanobacterium RM1_1_9]|nr:hypothetical protein [Oscillatoriales cyanobacterium SM2_3_0]NJO45946.1 hypothetical protein [Oscillatoriales cyanobacterium RM2_1_1]NJO70896.1 hypothetical protein [Oscillatoriales cyanobacterium RM1_1_9]
MWSEQLQLFLGIYEGKLRFFTPEGEMALTDQEATRLEKQQRAIAEQRAETAEQQVEIERQQKEKLAAKLRELNIDPDTL